MSNCIEYTLMELVDRFMVRSNIEKKKYLARYMVLAQECWEDIFQNTLWVVKSVWMPTKAGTPYNYIDMPGDCLRLISVGVDDKCGLIQPLFYNGQLNVVEKPKNKKCGCSCDCSGLCGAVNSTSVTIKLLFTINGVNYYQKQWLQYCSNGDVLEWTEIPTKKYNSIVGDGGDYSDDYNDDYLIAAAPFADYSIVTVKTQKKICKLEVKPCGCPVENEANEEMFFNCCGFYVNWSCSARKKHCKQYSENVNNNHYGEVKVSECNTKIFYRPSRLWKEVGNKEFPDYLLVNYQSTGTKIGAETLVPQYARNVMYAALDNGRKEYNSSFSQYEKDAAHYKLVDEKNKIQGYLNPIDLIFVSQAQDLAIRW